jgi:hypothetical protein
MPIIFLSLNAQKQSRCCMATTSAYFEAARLRIRKVFSCELLIGNQFLTDCNLQLLSSKKIIKVVICYYADKFMINLLHAQAKKQKLCNL